MVTSVVVSDVVVIVLVTASPVTVAGTVVVTLAGV